MAAAITEPLPHIPFTIPSGVAKKRHVYTTDRPYLRGYVPAAQHTEGAKNQFPPTQQSQNSIQSREDEEHVLPGNLSRSLRSSSRKGLPLVFEQGTETKLIMTGHDTGTEDNHMSLELANSIGYEIATADASKKHFQLPNGDIIKAIGTVIACVRFAQGQVTETSFITCHFNVFSNLALPALIGMAFLNATETLSKHTSRLAPLPSGWKRSLRLCSLGSATNQITCLLNGRQVMATADTGAEIALVSSDYAMRYGLLQNYSCEELELADGSREYTSGFGDVKLAIRTCETSEKQSWISKTVRFHVLERLCFDLILDEETVESFDIFRRDMSSVKLIAAGIMPSLGTIVHIGSVEKAMLSTKDNLKERLCLRCVLSKRNTNSK
jgi:predicted aspartyl protease